jgi:membrane-associated protein
MSLAEIFAKLRGMDIVALVSWLGMLGVPLIVFAESGIVFCFFFPGDSLLSTVGFLASQGHMNLPVLILATTFAAIVGNLLGYEIGLRVGMKLFPEGRDGRIIKRKHLQATERFYEEHGILALIMARFMPIVRTFTPFLAGMVRLPRRVFFFYTAVGAVAWCGGMTLLGYLFGRLIPPEKIDHILLPVVLAIIVISLLPSAWHFWREHRRSKAEAAALAAKE